MTRIWPGDVCVRRRPPVEVDVERVPEVAGRVVGRDVEHLEVRDVVLDLRALVRDEPELAEDLLDPRDRLERPGGGCPAGSGGPAP